MFELHKYDMSLWEPLNIDYGTKFNTLIIRVKEFKISSFMLKK